MAVGRKAEQVTAGGFTASKTHEGSPTLVITRTSEMENAKVKTECMENSETAPHFPQESRVSIWDTF